MNKWFKRLTMAVLTSGTSLAYYDFPKWLLSNKDNQLALPPPPEIPDVSTSDTMVDKEATDDLLMQEQDVIEDKRRRLLIAQSAFNQKGATLMQSKYDSKGSIF